MFVKFRIIVGDPIIKREGVGIQIRCLISRIFVDIPLKTRISKARYNCSGFLYVNGGSDLLILELFATVSFHKLCTANPLSPIYSPSTIPWSISPLLIYTQHDHNMSWIQHRRDIYRYSGIWLLLARNTGIPLFRICEFISHILGFGIAVFFMFENSGCKFGMSGACLDMKMFLYM